MVQSNLPKVLIHCSPYTLQCADLGGSVTACSLTPLLNLMLSNSSITDTFYTGLLFGFMVAVQASYTCIVAPTEGGCNPSTDYIKQLQQVTTDSVCRHDMSLETFGLNFL